MKITIPGTPIAKARHRQSGSHVYDPQADKKQEVFWQIRSLVLDAQMAKYGNTLGTVLAPDKPVRMKIDFFMPIPTSYSAKKKKLLYGTPHHIKPDLSNLIKFYEDCANSALFRDDAQIYAIKSSKIYDENPRTEITIEEYKNETED